MRQTGGGAEPCKGKGHCKLPLFVEPFVILCNYVSFLLNVFCFI